MNRTIALPRQALFAIVLSMFASTAASASACRFDSTRTMVHVATIPTALFVGPDYETHMRIDVNGCLEVRLPKHFLRAGVHTMQLRESDRKEIDAIIATGGLSGLTEAKLKSAAPHNPSLAGGSAQRPFVADAPINEIRVMDARRKRLGEPLRVESLMLLDIRPVDGEWHALRELAKKTAALANEASGLDAAIHQVRDRESIR
jgi:hypothetical protein